MSWDKEQWGVFLIFTVFLIPLGIVFIVMARRENKQDNNMLKYFNSKTFINSTNVGDSYEHSYR